MFSDASKLEVQEPRGLFICHESLKFDKDELSLLSRGPKFMVRDDLSSTDFNVELEKMIAKQNMDYNMSKDDCSDGSNTSLYKNTASITKATNNLMKPDATHTNSEDTVKQGEHDFDMLWEENSGGMVYNAKSKTLDLGNLAATKYNITKKYLCLSPIKGISKQTTNFVGLE